MSVVMFGVAEPVAEQRGMSPGRLATGKRDTGPGCRRFRILPEREVDGAQAPLTLPGILSTAA